MPATTREPRRRVTETPAGQTPPYANAVNAMMPMKAICDDCLKAYVSMGAESLRFLQMRAKKDFDLWQDLAACKDPMQAYDCQWRFYSQMMDDYMDEAARLYALANQTDEPGGGSETDRPSSTATTSIEAVRGRAA